MIELSRRRFIHGAGLLLAAPAIVQAASLMPVRAVAMPEHVEVYRAYVEVYRALMWTLPDGRPDFRWEIIEPGVSFQLNKESDDG